ncbi:MAG: FHA domain-containing protein [Spirochaetaceae bacterium]|jgi:pSer/pThr/pTyr-binding forkhead associated (FHA) protein|nr:FHA domain-containing protein [Spirochaetaceae bacterium]
MDETVYKRSKKGKSLNKDEKELLKLHSGKTNLKINKNITIGRDVSCSFRIDDPLISRKHAYIEFISDAAYIKDLGSTNATYVNNNPLKPNEQRRLRRGDVIKIGKTEIKIN